MPVYNATMEQSFGCKDLLSDDMALKHLDHMYAHFGQRLDQFRKEHEEDITKVHDDGCRSWKMEMEIKVTSPV
jgi:hypothetical protein